MKKIVVNKILSVLIAAVLILTELAILPKEASAETVSQVSIESEKLLYELSLPYTAKGSISVSVIAANSDTVNAHTVKIKPDFSDVETSFALKSINDQSKEIAASASYKFTMELVLTGVSSKIYTIPITLTDELGCINTCDIKIKVDVEAYEAPAVTTYNPSVSLNYLMLTTSGAIIAGQDCVLHLTMNNNSSYTLSDCSIQIGNISGDVSIYKGSDNAVLGDLYYYNNSRSVDIHLYAPQSAASSVVSIPVTMSGYDPSGEKFTKSETIYLALENSNAGEGESKSVVTPIIMVTGYTQKGTALAGSSFGLNITLTNTSSKNLRNIKVTIGDGSGVFVPKGSSNAYYIDCIDSKMTDTHTMNFNVSSDAPQGAMTMSVSISYEDYNGNCYTSSDTIAVSVIQETKFVIDTYETPSYAWVDESVSSEIRFYNMGKNTINNVQASVSGDFDVTKNASVYFGNISSGSTNTYKFTMVPHQTGSVSGKIVFTYDDASGKSHTEEVPFTYDVNGQVIDPDPIEPEDVDPEPVVRTFPWKLVLAILIVAALVFFVIKRNKKKKKAANLEIGDDD